LDQALSVAAILTVSLLVSFTLLPLIYYLFYKNQKLKIKSADSRLYSLVLANYKKHFNIIWHNKKIVLGSLLLTSPLVLALGLSLQNQGMPDINNFDHTLQISWNEPINIEQNLNRIHMLLKSIEGDYELMEGDVGTTQYLLQQEESQLNEANLFFSFKTIKQKELCLKKLDQTMKNNFPTASWQLQDAPNAFDQLFDDKKPYFELRFRDLSRNQPLAPQILNNLEKEIKELTQQDFYPGDGTAQESNAVININYDKLELFRIPHQTVKEALTRVFADKHIDDLTSFSETQHIIFKETESDLYSKMKGAMIINSKGVSYPLQEFVNFRFTNDYKTIIADNKGIYQGLNLDEKADVNILESFISKVAAESHMNLQLTGQYFQNKKNLHQLQLILLISLILLYFILAAQFESMLQPFIIM